MHANYSETLLMVLFVESLNMRTVSLQGSQSNAQKSIRTTFPLSDLSFNGPSELIQLSDERISGARSAGSAAKTVRQLATIWQSFCRALLQPDGSRWQRET
jgi:hypothetical protein